MVCHSLVQNSSIFDSVFAFVLFINVFACCISFILFKFLCHSVDNIKICNYLMECSKHIKRAALMTCPRFLNNVLGYKICPEYVPQHVTLYVDGVISYAICYTAEVLNHTLTV